MRILFDGKGDGGGMSQAEKDEAYAFQNNLAKAQHERMKKAQLKAEERAAKEREKEREAELKRQREGEREKAKLMAEEEMREAVIMNEADVPSQDDNTYGDLNLDVPLIESPDYGKDKDLE